MSSQEAGQPPAANGSITVPASTLTPAPSVEPRPKPTTTRDPNVTIEIAPAAAAEDAALVDALTDIVNTVYGEFESGIFKPGYKRTNVDEVRKFLSAGELGVCYFRDPAEPTAAAKPIGCIRIAQLGPAKGEFGMLAITAAHRGGGLGRELAQFAEERGRSLGWTVMVLELLVPQFFDHPQKAQLQAWYTRMGYQIVKLGQFEVDYPQLNAILAGPCEYRVFEKPLI